MFDISTLDHSSTSMLPNPPTAYQCDRFILKIAGIQALAIPGHALVEDAGIFLQKTPSYVPSSEQSEERVSRGKIWHDRIYSYLRPEDTFKNGTDDDAHINTITFLTNVSSTPRCILNSGATSSMTNHELKAPAHYHLPQYRPIQGISGSIAATKQCIIAFICPSAKTMS